MTTNGSYDVIIGTRAGGGTLANWLAASGKRILLVERGDYVPREKDNWDPRAVNLEGKYQTKEVWRDREGKPLHQPAVVDVPHFVDGRSLAPLLRGGRPAPETWRQAFLLEQYSDEGLIAPSLRSAQPVFVGIRTLRYKYVEYRTGVRKIYDLASDPYELSNFGASAPRDLVVPLSSLLRSLSTAASGLPRFRAALSVRFTVGRGFLQDHRHTVVSASWNQRCATLRKSPARRLREARQPGDRAREHRRGVPRGSCDSGGLG